MERRGTLHRWDDTKGFGFIRPDDGSPELFAHVSTMRGDRRPIPGDRVLYLAGRDERGRWRATHLRLDAPLTLDEPTIRQKPRAARAAEGTRPPQPRRRHAASPPAASPSMAVLLLGLVCCALPAAGCLRLLDAGMPWPAFAYGVGSLLAFVSYWQDKRRAQRDGWRTPERRLHLVELLGGWPGALLAQQLLRHKTRKVSFQVVFWLIVLTHQAGWLRYLFGLPPF